MAVTKGELVKNATLVEAVNRAKSGNGRLHFAGLVSDGGVHSHIDHLFGLIKAVKALEVCMLSSGRGSGTRAIHSLLRRRT